MVTWILKALWYIFCMISEQQKYISGIYRNIGFAVLAPFGSMVFQYLLFDKTFTLKKILICGAISASSWLLFFLGYNQIMEKKDVKWFNGDFDDCRIYGSSYASGGLLYIWPKKTERKEKLILIYK